MCDLRASGRIVGELISETWVDSMVEPLGFLILVGFGVRRLFSTGQASLTYVSVKSEFTVRMGGPVHVVECKLANLCSTTL